VYAVDEVGFKHSKRGERVRPNQLCRFVDVNTGDESPNLQVHGGPIKFDINTKSPHRIIDFIRRDVKWT
jgi:type I restriction enzyme M protein